MSDLSGPRRWIDAPEDAPDGFLESARAYAELGPSGLTRAQSFDALQLRVDRAQAVRGIWRVLSWSGAVVLAAAIYAIVQQRSPEPQPRPVPAVAAPAQEAATPRPNIDPPSVVAPNPAVTPTPSTTPPVAERKSIARLKRPAVKSATPRESATPSEPEAPAPAIGSLQSELQLLMRARRVVRPAPQRALELTAEHAAGYPTGAFAEEREVLAIEALRRLGRQREAAERAREFSARFPRSAHRERVEGALTGP